MASEKMITITHTDYVTVYEEPTMTLHGRQNDGEWTPEATWAPAPTVPVWTPTPTATPEDPNDHNGMPIAWVLLGLAGAAIFLALIGCLVHAIKRKRAGLGFFSKKKKPTNKPATQWFGGRDLEAGRGSDSGSPVTPPPRVVVNPGAYPPRV